MSTTRRTALRNPRVAGERGAAAVEFAFVLPVLLLVLSGIVDFGRAFNMQLTLTHAAREGARVAALGGDATAARNRTETSATPLTGLTTVVVTCPAVPTLTTPPASVVVSGVMDYLTPVSALMQFFGGTGLGSNVTIAGKAEMRCGG